MTTYRNGLGFDVHAFAGVGPLRLAGVKIEHPQGLAGHSDADVALHALMDALLGAAGLGDIGEHFPPDDPKWADARSINLLIAAYNMVRQAGWMCENVDLTIVAEAPKVGPHRDDMRKGIATALRIPPSCVSVKATSTEGLGALGRGEGIGALAVATIRRDGPENFPR